ncbi:MobV family relaxase [Clostridium sardiniense]|uniref:MobV family relaxase n=1 Tax=Clostridium sardiniense TaxID=29369 RepID=UPI001FD3779C|nr:MobV family relaxase [Clostridium sardiniense]MDQ0462236.1 hypothetical protein [Clostridium sardiniense]
MSYSVFRLQGIKTTNDLKGLGKHNKERISQTNIDINLDKSKNNIELVKCEGSYNNAFDKITLEMKKQHYERMKKTRKDRVKTFNQYVNSSKSDVACEMIFTSDEEFFKDMTENDVRDWAKISLNFVTDDIGFRKENIIHAIVHMDEKTPHLHIIAVPIVDSYDKRIKSNKLSISRAKYIENKYDLSKLQDKYNSKLKETGFQLDRGVKFTDRKHTKTSEFKAEIRKSINKEIKNITKEIQENSDLNLSLNFKNKSLVAENYILEKELSNKNNTIKNINDILKEENVEVIKTSNLDVKPVFGKYILNVNDYLNLQYEISNINNKYIKLQKFHNDLKQNYNTISIENRQLKETLKNEIEIKNEYKNKVEKIDVSIEKSNDLATFKETLINRYNSKLDLKEQEYTDNLNELEKVLKKKYLNKINTLEKEIKELKNDKICLSSKQYESIGIKSYLYRSMNELANNDKERFLEIIKDKSLPILLEDKRKLNILYERLNNELKNCGNKENNIDIEIYYGMLESLSTKVNNRIEIIEEIGLFKELKDNDINKISKIDIKKFKEKANIDAVNQKEEISFEPKFRHNKLEYQMER